MELYVKGPNSRIEQQDKICMEVSDDGVISERPQQYDRSTAEILYGGK